MERKLAFISESTKHIKHFALSGTLETLEEIQQEKKPSELAVKDLQHSK